MVLINPTSGGITFYQYLYRTLWNPIIFEKWIGAFLSRPTTSKRARVLPGARVLTAIKHRHKIVEVTWMRVCLIQWSPADKEVSDYDFPNKPGNNSMTPDGSKTRNQMSDTREGRRLFRLRHNANFVNTLKIQKHSCVVGSLYWPPTVEEWEKQSFSDPKRV